MIIITPFDSIRDTYTFLQVSIFFDILSKTTLKNYPLALKESNPVFDINFDT
jgi:hypothetical protein